MSTDLDKLIEGLAIPLKLAKATAAAVERSLPQYTRARNGEQCNTNERIDLAGAELRYLRALVDQLSYEYLTIKERADIARLRTKDGTPPEFETKTAD